MGRRDLPLSAEETYFPATRRLVSNYACRRLVCVGSANPPLEAGLDSQGLAQWTNGGKGTGMDGYAVAHVDEIEELDDGRAMMRAVRHHLGISAFGVNAWIAHEAGARVINEHDESEPDSNEELYLVLRGRASFEVDGERFDAAAGTFVFVRPGVKRTAFGEEPGMTIIAVGAVPGKPYEPGSCLRRCVRSTRQAITLKRRIGDANC